MSVVVYNGKKMKPFCLMNFELDEKEEIVEPPKEELPTSPIL